MAQALYTEFSTAKAKVEAAWQDIYQNTSYGWTSTVTGVAKGSKMTAASVLELGNKIASTDADAAAGAIAMGRCDANLTANNTTDNGTNYSSYHRSYNNTNKGGFYGGQRRHDIYRGNHTNNY